MLLLLLFVCSQTGFICLMLYRRDTHVVELQMGPSQLRLEDACAPEHFDVTRLPFVTLLGEHYESLFLFSVVSR